MDKNIKIAGVSIIEILIAMFLVAIALFTIATLFPQMGAHRKGIHESEQAKIIAMEVLEGLQMYSAIAAELNDATPSPNYNICTTPPPGYDDFYDEWYNVPKLIGAADYRVTWVSDCNGNPFNTAIVTVTWNKSGKEHTIEVTGVIR